MQEHKVLSQFPPLLAQLVHVEQAPVQAVVVGLAWVVGAALPVVVPWLRLCAPAVTVTVVVTAGWGYLLEQKLSAGGYLDSGNKAL